MNNDIISGSILNGIVSIITVVIKYPIHITDTALSSNLLTPLLFLNITNLVIHLFSMVYQIGHRLLDLSI